MEPKYFKPVLVTLAAMASIAFAGVVLLYAQHFGHGPLDSHSAWGEFGDYLGGTLNPVFGFLSFFALLTTLLIQTHQLQLSKTELQLTREELAASRFEYQRSADAQMEMSKSLTQQTHLANLSARIAATSAALQALDQAIARRRASPQGNTLDNVDYGGLTSRSTKLTRELEQLARQLNSD